jgi:hypothetical protein
VGRARIWAWSRVGDADVVGGHFEGAGLFRISGLVGFVGWLVAGWIRPVEDDAGDRGVALGFVLDDRKSAELEAGDVGEDGGAAGGDAVFGKENVQAGEGAIDAGGSVEVTGIGLLAEDGVAAVAVVTLLLEQVMRSAETRTRVLADVPAAASGRGAVLAASGFGIVGWHGDGGAHGDFLSGIETRRYRREGPLPPPRSFQNKSGRND